MNDLESREQDARAATFTNTRDALAQLGEDASDADRDATAARLGRDLNALFDLERQLAVAPLRRVEMAFAVLHVARLMRSRVPDGASLERWQRNCERWDDAAREVLWRLSPTARAMMKAGRMAKPSSRFGLEVAQ